MKLNCKFDNDKVKLGMLEFKLLFQNGQSLTHIRLIFNWTLWCITVNDCSHRKATLDILKNYSGNKCNYFKLITKITTYILSTNNKFKKNKLTYNDYFPS